MPKYSVTVGPITLEVTQQGRRMPARMAPWVGTGGGVTYRVEATPSSAPSIPGGRYRVDRPGRLIRFDVYAYSMVIDPESRTIQGQYLDDDSWEPHVLVMLRLAFAWALYHSRMGVMLHSASVFTPKGAMLLLGQSGAGKSTAAGTSPWPVGNDEANFLLVGDEPEVVATPFGGDLSPSPLSGRLRAAVRVVQARRDALTRNPGIYGVENGHPWQLLLTSLITIPMEEVIAWSSDALWDLVERVEARELVTDLQGSQWAEVEKWLKTDIPSPGT